MPAPSETPPRHIRPAAWSAALLAGFVVQLLLILFVTTIGLQQLGITTHNLDTVVNVHMRKQNLTKTMLNVARERTLIMLTLSKVDDPFERDDLLTRFNAKAAEYVVARQTLQDMPLNAREYKLIARQQQLIQVAQPIQTEVIDLINAQLNQEAERVTLTRAIPTQNQVLAVLFQLDAETQQVALAASRKAYEAQRVARFWMYLLCGAALVVGVIVAAVVLRHTTRISHEREHLAIHDALTSLPNRRLLLEHLEQALAHARRHKTMIGILFIDLDNFKRVNDTLGHAVGDQLICRVAQRLRSAVRSNDLVARLGGDEFVVVMSDVQATSQIFHVVDKILAVMVAPYQIAERELFNSCSIGISAYPTDGASSSDLLKNADTAMYYAKSSGKNRYHLYDAAMNAMAEERLQLDTDLHHALERNEFSFHYQPQINLNSGRTCTVEALIRWNHPAKGLLSPAAFLDMLEDTGVILPVGRTLLGAACTQGARWHAAGFSDLVIAINVSSKEFWNRDLLSNVQSALAQSGLPPQSLQLELTEGILMGDMDAAAHKILELKALGVSIAIDDFGTGYSSLAHLKRFPLDVLKIDRYFVKDLRHDSVNEALVNSILALCKGLNLDTVAEGVETRSQLDVLHKIGCPVVQGYLISQPVPAESVLALLQRDWRQELGLHTDPAA
ncbi:MAG TPA: EAL domain-containing protein [Thiobacillus sp.]|nr:MAG: diguanylate cyclase [Hydrogenophilales bacterium 28-61-11]OYZ56132.1 MAG: diguanylate cyclase [Hydrogenophilales bacterium 16-61-112]OZA42205.1 MAG: diguanylate cyclase [Hydrogenophilales bacterium 17-61-76]HQT31402.1 EAL domain-containing protein [Thiobacillus sp.]HQT70791.1 EAL domain-containing protein [Thiobacillus sp.]